jgi:hypothetical protein
MTTATANTRSAYPAPVDELLPRAVALADELGQVPSVRRLIAELRIGAPKARALAERVAEARQTPRTAAARSGRTRTADPVAPLAPDPATTRSGWPDAPDPVHAFPAGPAAVEPATATHARHDAATVDRAVAAQAAVPVDTPAPVTVTQPVPWWPVLLLALPAFVAIWSGWVGLGGLTGFGVVHPLPGIADEFAVNTAITLPIGVETYAAYALRAWLAPNAPVRARRFAKWSAIGSLVLGAAGQVTFHLMTAAGYTAAPWPVTTAVACLPVAVLGMGAALAHLLHNPNPNPNS